MDFPFMYRVRQHYSSTSIRSITEAIQQEFSKVDLTQKVSSGQKVAIAVGSRGISNLEIIVATTVQCLRNSGLEPFISPAMGSHGGATAKGQAKLLEELGINESTVGSPVISNADVISLGHLDSGAEVFFARDALEADHVVVINRVKPHTFFHGEVESGLNKMLAVGCGRSKGASSMHKFGLVDSIVPTAQKILEKAPILSGLAIVENETGGINTIKLALPHEFFEIDKKLLKMAKQLLPRIPTNDLDILIVDEMGKNISGTGIDPNVTGFWRRDGGLRKPDYRTLIVLDLTNESNGNATGIGMVDLTTQRLIEKIDLQVTYINAITSGVFRNTRLPVALENDKDVIEIAINQIPDSMHLRMARIKNTLHLETFWVTEALLPELRQREGISINNHPFPIEFDKQKRLISFFH